MKIVIGLLVGVNVLLLYWMTQQTSQEELMLLEVSTNMPALRLLNEDDALAITKSSVVPEPVETKPPSMDETSQQQEIREKPPIRAVFLELSCYSLGPFNEDKSLKSVDYMLSELGLVTIKKSETRREVNGFWVYIPPLPNRAEAKKVLLMLKDRGIKDFLIVSTGVKKNAISLGFFGTREGAQQHQTRMKTLGLSPVLEDSYRDVDGVWIDFSSPNSPPLPETVIEALESEYDEISVQKRQCLK